MGKQKVLSSKFNMSLGYIPVIISIILCEFIIQDIAIYIGTGVGLLFSIYMLQRKGSHVPPDYTILHNRNVIAIDYNVLFLHRLLFGSNVSIDIGNQCHYSAIRYLSEQKTLLKLPRRPNS